VPPWIKKSRSTSPTTFTKLLAELCLEIEEETDIGFEDALEVVSSDREDSLHHLHWPSTVGCEKADEPPRDEEDVRTDHPTLMLGGEKIPVPAMFSDQEVPEEEAEPEPEGAPEITSLPATDDEAFEVEEDILYSDIATPASERALAVDNEDVQRSLDLGEIFSFHNFEESKDELFPVSAGDVTGYSNDGEPEEGASSYPVAQDMLTDDTFPSCHALHHSGNEFASTPERELPQTEGEFPAW